MAAILLLPGLANAQELEPRAYSASPVGANFAVAGYGYTWGPVVFDPSLPIADVSAKVHIVPVGYGRTFGVAGKQGLVAATLPDLRFEGGFNRVFETDERVGRWDLLFSIGLSFFTK